MRALINLMWNCLDRVFGSRPPHSKTSRLMGMYLDQTNSKNTFVSEFQETRQRRNGKYSLNRERE